MAGRVEIIERRRLRVGDREIDLATLVPDGGGVATREIEGSGGAAVDESVVLGTPAGVYRFSVTRPQGGVLTVEATPQPPHAEVTRLRLDGATLHVAGTVLAEQADRAELFARRRGDGMEVAADAELDGDRFASSLDLAELAIPGDQRDVWNLRLQLGQRSLRLGTHLDGVPNRAEATEYPAVAVGDRRLQPYYTVENNVSVRSTLAGEVEEAAPAEPPEEDAKPRLARRVLGPPAILVHRLALTIAAALPGSPAAGRRPRRAHPPAPRVGDGGHGARGDEPGRVAGRERPVGRGGERRAAERAAVLPVPRRRRGDDGRRPAERRRAAGEAPQPARAPRRLRLPVVQPADGRAARPPPARDARWGRRRHASELQPAARRPSAQGHARRRAGAHELQRPPAWARARPQAPIPRARRAGRTDRGGPPGLCGGARVDEGRAAAQRGAAAGGRARTTREQGGRSRRAG